MIPVELQTSQRKIVFLSLQLSYFIPGTVFPSLLYSLRYSLYIDWLVTGQVPWGEATIYLNHIFSTPRRRFYSLKFSHDI